MFSTGAPSRAGLSDCPSPALQSSNNSAGNPNADLDPAPNSAGTLTTVGLMSRPLTNRINEGYPENLTATTASSYPLSSILEKLSSSTNQSNSNSIYQRIRKIIKSEKKLIKQKIVLTKELSSWCNILNDVGCKKLIYQYIGILELEIDIEERFIKKQEFMNQQLKNVNQRERRLNELKQKRNKVLVKLRENENKLGDSQITILTKEGLEELESSVTIVESKLSDTINIGFKNSLFDYTSYLHQAANELQDSSRKFLTHYNYSTASPKPPNSLQRVVAQNSMNTGLSRDVSTALNSEAVETSSKFSKKYMPITPTQIGRFLETKFSNIGNEANKKQCNENSNDLNNTTNPVATGLNLKCEHCSPNGFQILHANLPGSVLENDPSDTKNHWTT